VLTFDLIAVAVAVAVAAAAAAVLVVNHGSSLPYGALILEPIATLNQTCVPKPNYALLFTYLC